MILALLGAGALTWLILADLGRTFAITSGLYLSTTILLLLAQSYGSTVGERTLELLIRGAWILAACFAGLGLLNWANGHTPWAGLVWALCVAVFAASTAALASRTRRTP